MMFLAIGGLYARPFPPFSATYWLLQVKDKLLSLGDSGGNQLYPSDPTIGTRVDSWLPLDCCSFL
jgi:hypothetical protein